MLILNDDTLLLLWKYYIKKKCNRQEKCRNDK